MNGPLRDPRTRCLALLQDARKAARTFVVAAPRFVLSNGTDQVLVFPAAAAGPERVAAEATHRLLRTSHFRHATCLAFVFLLVTLASIAAGQHLLEQVLMNHVRDMTVAELRAQQASGELHSAPTLARALAERERLNASRQDRRIAVQDAQGQPLLGLDELLSPAMCQGTQPCLGWLRTRIPTPEGAHDWLGFAYLLPDGGRYVIAYDILPMLGRIHPVPLVAGIGVFFVLLLSLGAELHVGLRKVRRVDHIRTAMRQFAHGSMDTRVRIHGSDDEFDRLGADINRALARISRLVDEVRHATNHIAHELRTPLARLQQRLSDMALASEGDARHSHELSQAEEETQRIQYLFRAVMRISEIETGRCQHETRPIDAMALMSDLLDYCGVMAQSREIHVELRIDSPCRFDGDPTLLLQALVNLFDNAIKYAPPRSKIFLIARHVNQGVELGVADEGPGIAPDLRARAVQRFQRLTDDRSIQGHGLGLALVHAVAELHGGALTLGDHAQGEAASPGLVALIRIPLTLAPA